jgi:hypothetical protein
MSLLGKPVSDREIVNIGALRQVVGRETNDGADLAAPPASEVKYS